MTKCENMEELIPLYLDDMLEDDERLALEQHIETCTSCQNQLEQYRQLDNQLKAWSQEEIEPPVTFRRDLMSKLEEVQQTECQEQKGTGTIISFFQRKGVKKWMPYTAAAAIILCLIPTLFQQPQSNIAKQTEQEPLNSQPMEQGMDEVAQKEATLSKDNAGQSVTDHKVNQERKPSVEQGQANIRPTEEAPKNKKEEAPIKEKNPSKIQPDVQLGANEPTVNSQGSQGVIPPVNNTGDSNVAPIAEDQLPRFFMHTPDDEQSTKITELEEKLDQLQGKRDQLLLQQEKRSTDKRAKELSKLEEEIAAVQEELANLYNEQSAQHNVEEETAIE